MLIFLNLIIGLLIIRIQKCKQVQFPLYPSTNLTFTDYSTSSSIFFSTTKNTLPLLKLCLGTPPQCLFMAPDTASSITFLQSSLVKNKSFNQTFDISKSSTFENTQDVLSFYYIFRFLPHSIAKDVLSINDIHNILYSTDNENKLPFCLLTEMENLPAIEIGGYVGLSKNKRANDEIFQKYSFSIIDHFNLPIFSLTYRIDGAGVVNGGLFTIKSSDSSSNKCNSTDREDPTSARGWHCDVQTIKYGDLVMNFSSVVYFHSVNPVIMLPISIGEPIFESMKNKSGDQCYLLKERNKKVFACESDYDLNTFDNIVLYFSEENTLELHTKYMFERIKQMVNNKTMNLLKIMVSPLDDSAFILGIPAFINNEISFNTENSEILFHKDVLSSIPIPSMPTIIPQELTKTSDLISFVIIAFVFLICVSGTIILFISLSKLNNVFSFDLNIKNI